MKIIRTILSVSCVGAFIFGIAAASFAAEPGRDVPMADPFYNPETNSYFQMFHQPLDLNWAKANARARQKRYKGQSGRLAIVRDLKTLAFVREKFSKHWNSFRSANDEVWIGVRFFCKYRKLLWVDGKLQGPKAQGMWHRPWHRTNNRCGGRGYMSVYLTAASNGTALWQASGPSKAFHYYLVEYSAPNKSKDVSQNSNDTTITGAKP